MSDRRSGVSQSVEAAELVSRLTRLVVELAERVEKLEARGIEAPVRFTEPERLPKRLDR